jgi:hypothetical protein
MNQLASQENFFTSSVGPGSVSIVVQLYYTHLFVNHHALSAHGFLRSVAHNSMFAFEQTALVKTTVLKPWQF